MKTPILRLSILAALLLGLFPSVAVPAEDLDSGLLAGRVTSSRAPLSTARVYAYQMTDLNFRRVITDGNGEFLFQSLPAGIYKIIALKTGFLPAVVVLKRVSDEARQFLEVEMVAEVAGNAALGDDFWSIRKRIPKDVLRDLQGTQLAHLAEEPAPGAATTADGSFEAEMVALSGVDQGMIYGDAEIYGGQIELRGAVGDATVRLTGDYRELQPTRDDMTHLGGQASAFSVNVRSPEGSRFRLTTLSNQLQDGIASEVGIETHQLSWSRPLGTSGQTRFAAQYTNENNFYRQGAIHSEAIPEASEFWNLEGSYSTELSARARVETGVRYRQREMTFGDEEPPLDKDLLPSRRVDLYGLGGYQAHPSVVVEYGLYSTLQDGSVSLVPRGGVVLDLGGNWQAATTASHRLNDPSGESLYDFSHSLFQDFRSCETAEEYCYRLAVSRQGEVGSDLTIGALHRKFDERVRLYFNDDFFSFLDSLYVVPGDRLPELQFGLTRRLSPSILTHLESNVGSGGGGVLRSTSDLSYENRLSYVVTSLDTQFEKTSTGVFLAFHHLEQQLEPVQPSAGDGPEMELQRLQVMLSQNFDALLDMASTLAVQLNMEVSRGTGFEASLYDEELLKRIIGGVAVRF